MTGEIPLKSIRPSARRVLYALREAGQKGTTNTALCQPDVGGSRFGARLHEMRELGLVVFTAELRPGRYRYWLQVDPFEPQVTRVRAHDQAEPQLDLVEAA